MLKGKITFERAMLVLLAILLGANLWATFDRPPLTQMVTGSVEPIVEIDLGPVFGEQVTRQVRLGKVLTQIIQGQSLIMKAAGVQQPTQ